MSRNADVLYRDSARFATVSYKSRNVKTGDMAQVNILARGADPVRAAHVTGQDKAVCGSCPLRPSVGGVCYVNKAHGPLAIYRAVSRNPVKGLARILSRLGSKAIRLGAYGDPAFLPLPLLEQVTKGRKHTGYTHQWRKVSKRYAQYVMASVETLADRTKAKAKGYRTFRVTSDATDVASGEVLCPNYTSKVQCADCGLCNGASKAKDIVILAHGGTGNAAKFARLTQ